MARVIKRPDPRPEVAIVNCRCGGIVEYERGDVRSDQRDGSYVVCPC